jgi:hypothetical protein
MEQKSQPSEIPAVITQGDNEVRIDFDADIPRGIIEAQVAACQAHTCDCCTPEFREQVEEFKITKINDGISVQIKGAISAEHIRENMFACAPKLRHQD